MGHRALAHHGEDYTVRFVLLGHSVVNPRFGKNIDTLFCWSDGPAQFKSIAYLGTIAKEYMWRHTLTRCDINYGAPKHWKGPWGRMLGTLGHVFKQAWMEKPLKTLEDVANVYQ